MTTIAGNRHVEILVVEDNVGDKLIIENAFKDCGYPHNVSVVVDGVQAIDFLRKQNNYEKAPNIQMVILDINLPRKSGMEVLQEIRKTKETSHIPVIILTSSRSQRDVMNFYQNTANCFLTKPIRLDDFTVLLKKTIEFWLGIVQLPFMK